MTAKKTINRTKKAAPVASRPATKSVRKATPVAVKPASEEPESTPEPKSKQPWYIGLLIAGLLILIGTTLLALPGDMPHFEQRAFALINDVHLPDWVTSQVAKPLSNAVWGMVGLVAVLLLVPKFRWRAWQYAAAAGATYVFVYIIEHIVDRGRPADLPYDVILRASQDGPGYPSGHVAVLTALVLMIWPFVAWPWRILLLALIAAEAWSRVFLGVHALLDVVGAVGAGAVVVGGIYLLPRKIKSFFRLG
jgi:membrane-associated phospholipid phosphatase